MRLGRSLSRRAVVPAVLALWLAGTVGYAEPIREIVVTENRKTTTDTVELIAQISVGDPWSPEMTEVVTSRLVSSGLFRDVEVFWAPVAGGVRVHLVVHDKHSWVIAPAFYTQPTNIGGGLGFGENNLFGENQKLLLFGQIATGDSFFIGAWIIPSIGGSRFYAQIDTFLKRSRNIEYAAPKSYLDDPAAIRRSYINYLNGGIRLGVNLFRGLAFDTRLRGAYVSYSRVELDTRDNPEATLADIDPSLSDPSQVPKPGAEGWDVSSEFTLTLDRRANWYGVASGYRATLTYERSILSNDFRYYQFNTSLYRAWRVLDRHNLVVKARADIGHHLPFQQEFVTGGPSMRGWINNQFRGDLRGLVNVEYSVPLVTVAGLSFRGLGFVDSSYTTFLSTDNPQRHYLPGAAARGLAPLKNSIGLGTRLFMRQIVLPLLGLDFGYGLEARDFQIYLAIGLTD